MAVKRALPRMALELQSAAAMQSESPAEDYLRRLFHRWFIQYNPLYLLSAVLVLYGLYSIEGAFADQRSITGHLVVLGVTELYSVALILGGAMLVRIGLRRPAVFVALLAVVYQADPAFGTQSFALFGRIGALWSFVWLAMFVAKLHALGWALELEVSRSAKATASFAAAGLAAIPHLARHVDARGLGMIVGLWLFGLFAMGAWTSRAITSKRTLDGWGRTVLRRALLATWTIWGALAIGYALFWTNNYHLDRATFVPIAMLLATRFLRRELSVFVAVAGTLGLVAAVAPRVLSMAAISSAIVLVLHALRRPAVRTPEQEDVAEIYRGVPADEPEREMIYERSSPAAMTRQLAWAGYCAYLAIWTFSWTGGALPPHLFALDALLGLGVLVAYATLGRRTVILVPAFASAAHWSIVVHLVRAPQTTLEWGASTVGLGFALLFGALLGSWRIQTHDSRRTLEDPLREGLV